MAKEMIVEQSVIINIPSQKAYNYLKFCKNQENFSVWNMADPGKKTTATGTDGTEGFVYTWDSNQKSVGAGSQQFVKLVEGKSIEYVINFLRPMKNIGHAGFKLESLINNQTTVTWTFRSPTKFPMSLFKGIFIKMLSKDLAKSLQNLKGILEKEG